MKFFGQSSRIINAYSTVKNYYCYIFSISRVGNHIESRTIGIIYFFIFFNPDQRELKPKGTTTYTATIALRPLAFAW